MSGTNAKTDAATSGDACLARANLEAASHLIIGTAGHIDHGKTSLVRALTGVDTDRLPEEKRRGVTIELGFARLDWGGVCFGVVDVPGHERFIRTMVAGATGIDVALLVIAGDDGVMPQTREHVEILDLLGVRPVVVAVTKCDMVDAELAEMVAEEARELLAETSLHCVGVATVSAVRGDGLDGLRALLIEAADLANETIASRRSGPFRLAIDRVFTVQGRGTVVTGTALQGSASVGDEVEVWPEGFACRVREAQTHGQASEHVQGGQRAALNLIGVDRDRIERGCELAAPGYLRATRIVDVRLRCLLSARGPIRSRSRVRVCMGTREVMGRVVTTDGSAIEPGASTYAQFRLSEPVTAVHGQRFIVRHETAGRTVGGGHVLRCDSARRSIRGAAAAGMLAALEDADAAARVEQVLMFHGFAAPPALTVAAEAGVDVDQVQPTIDALAADGRLVSIAGANGRVPAVLLKQVRSRADRWLRLFHETHADEPGVARDVLSGYLERKSVRGAGAALIEQMLAKGELRRLGPYYCHPEHAPALSSQDEKILEEMLAEYAAAGFQPPAPAGLRVAERANKQRIEKLLKIAVATRQLVYVDGTIYLHADVERKLRAEVRRVIESNGDTSTSAIKDALGTSRKYAVPLLEHLDRIGFTKRQGDVRVFADGGGE